jgi:DUF4097 and DUF4098 domain-containing protein YvlB
MRRAAILALTFFMAAAAHAAIDDTMRRGFNVSEGGKLTLNADLGDVTIVTGGSGVAVEIVRTARTSDRDKATQIFKDLDIQFAQKGNDVEITTDWDHDWFNWNSPLRVKWNIRVPSRYSVEVKTSGGNIDLTNVTGTVNVRTSGGNIKGGKIDGPVMARTSGGNVELDSATGDVDVRTSGGNVRIDDAQRAVTAATSGGSIAVTRAGGNVNARTSGGNIRIVEAGGQIDASTSGGSIVASFTRQPGGDSTLSTSGGDVRVSLARNVGAELDARASGGGIDADVPVTVVGTQSEGTLRGSIGGGGPKLTLRTSGGGISIQPM